jgi:hypothetical protein
VFYADGRFVLLVSVADDSSALRSCLLQRACKKGAGSLAPHLVAKTTAQSGLPLRPGKCATQTHDYIRHGTTTLFAALDVLQGTVIGGCFDRRQHEEFLKFLRQIDRETPQDRQLHLVADNYSTHKHAAVKNWVKRHPRFHLHFTPTSSSWLNLVER